MRDVNDTDVWSDGTQINLGYANIPGVGNADCGQHAAGDVAGVYAVGSIDYVPGRSPDQPPQVNRTPDEFREGHGMVEDALLSYPIPLRAHGIAFVDLVTDAFHYGRIMSNRTLISHTDVERDANQRAMFAVFKLRRGQSMQLRGYRRVQQVHVTTLAGFRAYCAREFSLEDGFFYYCRFARP